MDFDVKVSRVKSLKQCHGDSVIVAQSLSSQFTDKLFIIINKNDHKRV